MKTTEEKRAAVLAYCNDVCPNVGDGHNETATSGTIIHSKDQAWSWLDGLGSRIYINPNMSKATTNAMYSILGLESRDAVEAERAKSTALVEAVNKAIFDLTDEDADPDEDAYDFGQRISEDLEKALEAYKKGGNNA